MNLRKKQKAETRQRILKSAARLFRRHGFAATGIDAVMEDSGLTAGGFYSHFKSKNELLGECLKEAFAGSMKKLTAGVSGSPAQMRKQILARYVSPEHRDRMEEGCPLVGIAAELGRHARQTSKHTADHLELLLSELQKYGLTRKAALGEISRAVGALLLSRLVRGEDLSDEILDSAR